MERTYVVASRYSSIILVICTLKSLQVRLECAVLVLVIFIDIFVVVKLRYITIELENSMILLRHPVYWYHLTICIFSSEIARESFLFSSLLLHKSVLLNHLTCALMPKMAKWCDDHVVYYLHSITVVSKLRSHHPSCLQVLHFIAKFQSLKCIR